MSAWTQQFEPIPALILLIALSIPQAAVAAPYEHATTDIEYYPVADSTGCYYNFQHYDEGDRILTNEPCLNCTCHNRMLMCYLRVCPFTKAIGQDCKVEKRADQCCPVITCPEVPVQLLSSTTQSSTAVGHLDAYGCSIDGLFYTDGARVPSDPTKPCELCYCIRNKTACVMQQCTLEVEGCKPVYQEGVCCPVRYNCEHPDYNLLETTTRRLITTTTSVPTTTLAGPVDCIYENEVYADGALIIKDKPCERCYCMKGDIICAVQKCNPTPLDKVNCTALPPKEGQCCPDTYECDHINEEELTTEFLRTTISSAISEESTTSSAEIELKSEEPGAVTTVKYEATDEIKEIGEEPTVPSIVEEGEIVQQPSDAKTEQPEEKPFEGGVTSPVDETPYVTESIAEEAEKPTSQEVTEQLEILPTTVKVPETKIPDQEPEEIPEENSSTTQDEIVGTDETGYTSQPPKQTESPEPIETETESVKEPEKTVIGEATTVTSYITTTPVPQKPEYTTEEQLPETVSTELPPRKPSTSEKEPQQVPVTEEEEAEEPQQVPVYDEGEEEEPQQVPIYEKGEEHEAETEKAIKAQVPGETHTSKKVDEDIEHPQVVQQVTEVAPEIGSGLPHEMEVEQQTTQLSSEEEKEISKEEKVTEETPSGTTSVLPSELPEYTTKQTDEEEEEEEKEKNVTDLISGPTVTEKSQEKEITTASPAELPRTTLSEEQTGKSTKTEQPVGTTERITTDSEVIKESGLSETELPVTESGTAELPQEIITEVPELEITEKPKDYTEEEKGTELPKEYTTQVPVAVSESTELPKEEEIPETVPSESPVEPSESTEEVKLEIGEYTTALPEVIVTLNVEEESTGLSKIPEREYTGLSTEEPVTEKSTGESTDKQPTSIESSTEVIQVAHEEQTEISSEISTAEQPQLPEEEIPAGTEKAETPSEQSISEEEIYPGTEKAEQLPEQSTSEQEEEETGKVEGTEKSRVPQQETERPLVYVTEGPITAETTEFVETTKEYVSGEQITLRPSEEDKITYTVQPEEIGSTAGPQEIEVTEVTQGQFTETVGISEEPKKPTFESQLTEKPEYTTEVVSEETTKFVEEPSISEAEIPHKYPVEPQQHTEKPEIAEIPVTEPEEVPTSAILPIGESVKPIEVEKSTEGGVVEQTTPIADKKGTYIPQEEIQQGEVTTYLPQEEEKEVGETEEGEKVGEEGEKEKEVEGEEEKGEKKQVEQEEGGKEEGKQTTELPVTASRDEDQQRETKTPEKVTTSPGLYSEEPSKESSEAEKVPGQITTVLYTEEDLSSNEVTEKPIYDTSVHDSFQHPQTEEEQEEEEYGIPGEGSCLVDGQTYKNNSNVPPINHCQVSCKCVSSILQCESITCTPPPTDLQHCMPVYQGPDSCCPTYSCTVPGVTSMKSDSHKLETTTVKITPEGIDVNVIIPSEEGTVRPDITTGSWREATELPEFTLHEEGILQTSLPDLVTEKSKVSEPTETTTSRIPEITTVKTDSYVPDHTEAEISTERATELSQERKKPSEQITTVSQEQTTSQPVSQTEHELGVQETGYPTGAVHDEIPDEEENIIDAHDITAAPPVSSSEQPLETVTTVAEELQTTITPLESGPYSTEKGETESQPQITEGTPEIIKFEGVTDSSLEATAEDITGKSSSSVSEITTIKSEQVSEGITEESEKDTDVPEEKTQTPQITKAEPEESVTETLEEETDKESSVPVSLTESTLAMVPEKEKPDITEQLGESEKEAATTLPEQFLEHTVKPSKEYTDELETATKYTEIKSTPEGPEVSTQPPLIVTQEVSTEEIKEKLPSVDEAIPLHEEKKVTEYPESQETVTTPELPSSPEKLPPKESEIEIGEVVIEPGTTEKIPESIGLGTETTKETETSSKPERTSTEESELTTTSALDTGRPSETEVTKTLETASTEYSGVEKVYTEEPIDTSSKSEESEVPSSTTFEEGGELTTPQYVPESSSQVSKTQEPEEEKTSLSPEQSTERVTSAIEEETTEHKTTPPTREGTTSPSDYVPESSSPSDSLPDTTEKEIITVSSESTVATGETKVTKRPFIYIPPIYESGDEYEPETIETTEKEIPVPSEEGGLITELPTVMTGETSHDYEGITESGKLPEVTITETTPKITEPVVTVTAIPIRPFETEAPSLVTEKKPLVSEEGIETEIPPREGEPVTEKEAITEPVVTVTAQSIFTEETTLSETQKQSKPTEEETEKPFKPETEYVSKLSTEKPSEIVTEQVTPISTIESLEPVTTVQTSIDSERLTSTPTAFEVGRVTTVQPSIEGGETTVTAESEKISTGQPTGEIEVTTPETSTGGGFEGGRITTVQPSEETETVTLGQPAVEIEEKATIKPLVDTEAATTLKPSVEAEITTQVSSGVEEIITEGTTGFAKITTTQPSTGVERLTTVQAPPEFQGVTVSQPVAETEERTTIPSSVETEEVIGTRPTIPGEDQQPQIEETKEPGVQGKPEEVFTSPTMTSTPPSNISTELFTSGAEEEITKKHVFGELSTSAPATLTSSTTSEPQQEIAEEPEYQSPVEEEDYGEDQSAFGPGTCRYGGKVYVSAQQIPRDDPCDFCFCFRSDIICLQQSCPPPIPRCHEEPIRGFCCPRYECPVAMATSVNITTTSTTTTTTLPPHFFSHAYKGRAHRSGCQIQNRAYNVGEEIKSASGPCLHCVCGSNGQMKCDPKACSPEPMLRQMIAVAESRRKR